MMTPWTMIMLGVLSVVVVLIVVTMIVILILFCLIILKKGINLLIGLFILMYVSHHHLGLPNYMHALTAKKASYICKILMYALEHASTASFSERKKGTMSIEQSSKRDVIIEDSQSAADRPTVGDHTGLQEEKETLEGVYEEIDFTMEYNMSYSTVTQTAM